MNESMVTVKWYAEQDPANDALDILEGYGFHAVIRELIDENTDSGYTYVIDVPQFEADEVAEILIAYGEVQDQELDLSNPE